MKLNITFFHSPTHPFNTLKAIEVVDYSVFVRIRELQVKNAVLTSGFARGLAPHSGHPGPKMGRVELHPNSENCAGTNSSASAPGSGHETKEQLNAASLAQTEMFSSDHRAFFNRSSKRSVG